MGSLSFIEYALAFFACCIGAQFLIIFARPFRRSHPLEKNQSFEPFTSVIMPCMGADRGFEGFLRSLEDQDYKNVEYIFCFADSHDPGVSLIKRIDPKVNYRITIAEHLETTSGMNENMIAGLKESSPDSKVLAFLDVDGKIPKRYLRSMVAPLSSYRYICSSTFRKFEAKNLGGMIAKYWNYLSLYFREMPESAFPWGGGMAFRREDLSRLNLPDIWYGILDDDMPLMRHMKAEGHEIYLVDEYCISEVEYSIKGALEWIRRTTVYPALYFPELRRLHLLQEVFVISYIALYLATGATVFLAPLAGFALLITLLTFRHGTWKERALAPWITLMLMISAIWTSTTLPFLRRIEWAAQEYKFDSTGKVYSRRRIEETPEKKQAIA